jgi:small nuclear ribonucleoprotein (snRNP)-like protein
MKKLIIGLLCVFVVSALYAEVSDDVWKALINQKVIIEKNDGSEVAGKLTSVADLVVVVIKADGNVVSVTKKDVSSVRVNTASETTAGAAPSQVADVPLRQMYFQFDPLGFLQIGPSAEIGYRVTPSTLVGLAVRFEGLGLLYQDIATSGFQWNASLTNMAVEGMVYQLFSAFGINRWYLQGMFGIAWGSTNGVDFGGNWQGNEYHLEIAVGGGYRWRFISGFFVDLGALAGVGPQLSNTKYYTSNPSTIINNGLNVYIVGMLQVHLGWEF